MTNEFNIHKGVKQGCVLSPILFSIFINEFVKLLRESNFGVRMNGVWMGGLFWADDVILIANNEREMTEMLEIANIFAKEWKLGFNHEKSNVMVVGKRINKDKEWKLGEKSIKEVNSYKYLGVYISSNMSEHSHYEHVIQKGNRLIAYIKGIIANLDDFNRVYYGNILWKTIAIPSINYACSIWYNKSKKDNEDLEKVQLQMARFLLKAPRYTPKEALYGDLGWVPLSKLHKLSRVKLFNRFITMDDHRWPNIVLNSMLQLKCDFDRLKYKFLSSCVDIFEKCTDIGFYNNVFDNDSLTLVPFSVSNVERYCKTYKWSNDVSGLCTLCGNGEIEDIKHFLLNCKAFDNIRMKELSNLQNNLVLCNDYDTWNRYTTATADDKLQYILGGDSIAICKESETFFDLFCKQYTRAAWEKRSELKSPNI
ncbi:uncharacterized protein [Antedon mediterranea]|uniref:uncharacterized protein n=1 Tax=Antedon mediterranea TaxID=105859 RepID=UPI003AF76078